VLVAVNKEMLFDRLHQNGKTIKSYGVKTLSLFGSFANDRAIRNESDVDILVEFETDRKNFDNFIDLDIFLEDLLKRNVELVTRQSLSRYIGPHILNQLQDVDL
jgi:uncharacterized protein